MLTIASPEVTINLRQAICALAESLGLVGIDEKQHGERVAYMGVQCATAMGWDQQRLNDLFHAGLLHDSGVSSSRLHLKLVTELDWEGSEAHCILGEDLVGKFGPLSHLGPLIRYHHTHWEVLKESDLDETSALSANLIYLVDRVDALLAQHAGAEDRYEKVRGAVRELAGSFFSPELTEALLKVSGNEAFWLAMEPLNLAEYIRDMAQQGDSAVVDFEDLRRLACIFARIVDAKSHFTFEHSKGVANLAVHIGHLVGLAPERGKMLEIAGLLHDLGKLGVPDEVLDKPGKLNAAEIAIMHRHSYDTFRILRQIGGLEEIAEWAGNHHETLLGDGYPFHHDGSNLPLETRILVVADIFQALAQDRPYRDSLPPDQIMDILHEMAEAGRVDKEIIAVVDGDREACWHAATVFDKESVVAL